MFVLTTDTHRHIMRLRILFLLKREITNLFPLQIATDDNLNSSASIPLLYPHCLLCLKIITLLYKNIDCEQSLIRTRRILSEKAD